MKTTQFDALKISKMASGHLCLTLSERISWETFPPFAEYLLNSVGGTISEKYDGSDIRLWCVAIDNSTLRLVFDDYPLMVSLESSDERGDAVIGRLYEKLT